MANPVKVIKGAAKAAKSMSAGKAKAAKKVGRKIDKQGNLVTRRGVGIVSEAPIKKGKNSKANVTDFKSIDKALGNPSKRYLPRSERKGLKSTAAMKAWETTFYLGGRVPVKKKGK